MDTKKMVYNGALQFITFWAFTCRKWAHGDLEIKKNNNNKKKIPENGSNDFLEIWHEVGNPELQKSDRNRF